MKRRPNTYKGNNKPNKKDVLLPFSFAQEAIKWKKDNCNNCKNKCEFLKLIDRYISYQTIQGNEKDCTILRGCAHKRGYRKFKTL